MTYQITLEENASAGDISRIGKGIDRHVSELFPEKSVGTITLFVRDEAGEIVGGVSGNYGSLGWLYIDALWISEHLRDCGYGTKLMRMIEAEGVRHGCRNVYLNTFSFEAPEFYEHEYESRYALFSTDRILPAGSLNQAMSGACPPAGAR